MTRDETVALFLECEAKRGEARAAALAGGKSEHEARTSRMRPPRRIGTPGPSPCSPNAGGWKPKAAGPLRKTSSEA